MEKDPTFSELDPNFKGTSLENEEFFSFGKDTILENFKEDASDALFLVKLYDKYKDKIKLSYPAYYVKGKNGPYYNSICFQPERYEDCDYTYYEGIYVSCGKGNTTWLLDGSEVYEESIRDLIEINESEDSFLKEINNS